MLFEVVFVVLGAEGTGSAVADLGWGEVREVEGDGESFCYISGLDAPECGEMRRAGLG